VTFIVEPSFGDVSSANESAAFITAIDDMLSKGISAGCQASPLEYCPTLNVTRGQMAVFIIRSIYGSNDFSYNPTPYFTDATPSSVGSFFPYVQKMHELGITSGCTTTTYCPDLNVTRGQMAVFIIRARYGTSFDFDYPSTPLFTDATPDSVGSFFKYIQRMKMDNITSGCTTTTYCPDLIVTRDQMAVFMIRGGFNQLLPPTEPIITSASPATGGLGETVNVTLTGVNTSFTQDTTTVSAGAGLTVGTLTVNSPTSLTVQLTIASNATPNPVSLLVTTGTEEAVLPNGFTITSDPAVGLIAYWNGNNTTMNSISSLSGILMSGATYASAASRTLGLPDAQAFSLNGTSSYVQAAAGEVGTVSGARTLAAWVYPNASSGLGMPILTGSDIFGITGTTGTCSSGGQYQLYIDDAGTCYVSDISLAPGVWSFVAVTFDGSKVVFYIDGVASVAVPAAQMSSYGLVTLEIGGNTLGGSSSGASFNGLLSEVQVYNRALSPAEIQGLYAP
jgi:Concanavalin A-like lectin/glucanases superfamily/S-layer homology domain